MNSIWTIIIVVGIILRTVFFMPHVHTAEIKHVLFGSTVTLSCNISYLYHTTWLKHSPDHTPTVVVCSRLREGQPFQEFQLSSRFSVALLNRSLALRITTVEERDLGLYYCIAIINTQLTIGRGTMLQISSSDSVWFVFHDWYLVVVCFGLLILILVICITHWKVKSNKSKKTPTAQ